MSRLQQLWVWVCDEILMIFFRSLRVRLFSSYQINSVLFCIQISEKGKKNKNYYNSKLNLSWFARPLNFLETQKKKTVTSLVCDDSLFLHRAELKFLTGKWMWFIARKRTIAEGTWCNRRSKQVCSWQLEKKIKKAKKKWKSKWKNPKSYVYIYSAKPLI